jgi:type IV pilus assembly protein PilQ
MLRIRILMLSGLLVFTNQSAIVFAQSLEEELSVLDDLPEADMSDSQGFDMAQSPFDNAEPPDDFDFDEEPQNLKQEVAQLPVFDSDVTAPPSALTGVDNEPLAHLTAMDFQQLTDRVRLRLKTDRGIDYRVVERPDRRQVTLEIQNAKIATKVLKRALDTGEFEGPVALIKAFESKSGAGASVKVLFQLREYDRAQVTRAGTDLLIDFPIKSKFGKLFEVAGEAPVLPETILSSFDKMKFSGARMNIRVKDAPLADVLALISKASGQDFILSKESDRTVTTQMNDAPWDQVLSMILLNANMGYQKIGKTYRIAPADDLRKELEAAVESDKKQKELAVTETRIYPINYAKAEELDKIVKTFLTPTRGSSSVEDRTNSIVVSDVREVLDRIQAYVKAVDLQTPQILIEARVVQVTDEVRKNLDFRWRAGGAESYINMGESTLGLVTPPNAGLRINTSLPGIDAITAWLNMYETQNLTKIIASPKVTALNNQKAEVFDGIETAILQPPTEAGGAPTTVFREALLKLDVTPSVTSDGFVMMNVMLSKDDVVNPAGAIARRGANTTLMVESGRTAVIGGVFIDTDIGEERKLSYLGSLPVLGRLFTPFRESRREQRELLMFISPRILNADRTTLMSTGSSSTQASF